ncbi:MAG: hypothetical protein ACFBSC_13035 [Microcoleaceae cyanobacterium]
MLQSFTILNNRYSQQFALTLFSTLVTLLTIGQQSATAQINQAIVQEILDGEEVFIEQEQAEVEDLANFGQLVSTEKSRAGLVFNNGAAGRLGVNSRVTVGQCVEVQSGAVVVSGPVNGCIAGFSVGVEGTVYILETNEDGSGTVKVIEGSVEISSEDESAEPVTVEEGEKISVLPGVLGEIVEITPEELADILQGELFSGFRIPITPQGALQSACFRTVPPGFTCSSNGVPRPVVPSVPRPPIPGGLPF